MPRGVRDEGRVARSRLIVERVLARSARKGWDARHTAEVVIRSLRPARVAAGVVGPCFYCGDELADTVDHMLPVSVGGTDDRANLVSACWPCNELKGTADVLTFRWRHPFGSDKAKERAYHDLYDQSPVIQARLAALEERARNLPPGKSLSMPFGEVVDSPPWLYQETEAA
jgi:5-methylcytosine-specific restriction endonuclease McrA